MFHELWLYLVWHINIVYGTGCDILLLIDQILSLFKLLSLSNGSRHSPSNPCTAAPGNHIML